MTERNPVDGSAQAQAALPEGETSHKRIFESSKIPVVVMDAENFRYVDCNPAAVKIFSAATRAEVLGRSPQDFSCLTGGVKTVA